MLRWGGGVTFSSLQRPLMCDLREVYYGFALLKYGKNYGMLGEGGGGGLLFRRKTTLADLHHHPSKQMSGKKSHSTPRRDGCVTLAGLYTGVWTYS